MNNTGKLLLALSLVAKTTSGTVSAQDNLPGEFGASVERCEAYSEMGRGELQSVLEDLLQNRPDDACIPFVVDLLGGTPIAQVESNNPSNVLVLSTNQEAYS